ncbi:hypothetical protein RFI_06664 [Reticulomyxa filosa]|uniref:HYDIN/VesB/CFA65-like Ig-like domain-containing protein n=1 Tax=Reticulomyxa filosa TaxID=46433 RepID=X6NVY1_RETFI|nr:hypothetical protein RFI_06664 [Reticulomyxa filosa]|eukprot:ETO30455.1 hypothetical protein RFI_06664 [Reticulomyxa filosa]
MPLHFEFSRIANFHVEPRFRQLLPKQSVRLLCTYIPKQLGIFSSGLVLQLNHGIETMELRVRGTCSGYGMSLLPYARRAGDQLLASPQCDPHVTTNNNELVKPKIKGHHLGSKLVGGIDKIPLDFKPCIKLITSAQFTSGNKENKDPLDGHQPHQTQTTMQEPAVQKDSGNAATITTEKICVRNDQNDLNDKKQHSYIPPFQSVTRDWNKMLKRLKFFPQLAADKTLEETAYFQASTQLNASEWSQSTLSAHATREKRSQTKANADKTKKHAQKEHVPEVRIPKDDIESDERESSPLEDSTDMNMNLYSGLKEPRLGLPKSLVSDHRLYLGNNVIVDPLTVGQDFALVKQNKVRTKNGNDAHAATPKKCKALPETQAELRDCNSSLTREELRNLSFMPKVLELKEVCVRSMVKKLVTITNTCKKSILVEMDIANNKYAVDLQHSGPQLSQVIPSHEMAGFDLVLQCTQVKEVDTNIIFKVNNLHSLAIPLKAKIIPINLHLSTQILEFKFLPQALDFHVIQILVLRNSLPLPVTYRIQCPLTEIRSHPTQGTIEPQSSSKVNFMWEPTQARSFENQKISDYVSVQIVDGVEKTVRCMTYLPEAQCQLSAKQILFDSIAIGVKHQKTVTIRNLGNTFTVFRVAHLPPCLIISPHIAKLDIGECMLLTVTFLSCDAQDYGASSTEHFTFQVIRKKKKKYFVIINTDEKVILQVRGGAPLTLEVKAHVICPEVEILQREFNFGGVLLGDTKLLPLTIKNDSNVEAYLFLDLASQESEYQSLDIEYPEEWSHESGEPLLCSIVRLEREEGSIAASNRQSDDELEPIDAIRKKRSSRVSSDSKSQLQLASSPESNLFFNELKFFNEKRDKVMEISNSSRSLKELYTENVQIVHCDFLRQYGSQAKDSSSSLIFFFFFFFFFF